MELELLPIFVGLFVLVCDYVISCTSTYELKLTFFSALVVAALKASSSSPPPSLSFHEMTVAPKIAKTIPPTWSQVGTESWIMRLSNKGTKHLRLSIAYMGPPFPVLNA